MPQARDNETQRPTAERSRVSAGGPRVVPVGPVAVSSDGRTTRVSAEVDDAEVFFETGDAELLPAAEAFASALLPAAVQRGWRLRMADPLDPEWLDGVADILRVWSEWWDTSADLDDVLDAPVSSSPAGGRREGIGMPFSGGLDSFHTLLCSGREIQTLVMAHGFDIKLDDDRRMTPAAESLRAVAAAVGAQPVVIRTNLRRIRPVRGAGWGRTHGGALAALGHLCADEFGDLVIAGTYTREAGHAWGSSWDTDPGWSSSRLQVSHFGEDWSRAAKMEAVVHHPLVREHLRVCWENRADTGNCGECEKCVRTMVHVSLLGEDVDEWPFGGTGSLVERVERVDSVHPQQVSSYEPMIEICDDPQLRGAMERLTERAYDPFEDRAQRVRRREARRA